MKKQAKDNLLSDTQLKYYKKLKTKLFRMKQKISKMQDKYKQQRKDLDNKQLKICFGTKKLYLAQYHLKANGFDNHEQWLKAFRKNRDKNILYVGSKGETCCNQLMQLKTIDKNNYQIKLRKNTKQKEHIYGLCKFSYLYEELYNNLLDKNNHGISYRIIFKGKKCYLQAMITLYRDTITSKNYGVIGMDFNDGFIELSETDSKGNIVNIKHFDLFYHGCGEKADEEMSQIANKITKYALNCGKNIVIEDLHFDKKKSTTQKATSEHGKKYNKMIHALDYSRYTKKFENSTFRNEVELVKINPAYTSKIAQQKYCDSRKLTVHQGASYVIARRGQGFKDKYIH